MPGGEEIIVATLLKMHLGHIIFSRDQAIIAKPILNLPYISLVSIINNFGLLKPVHHNTRRCSTVITAVLNGPAENITQIICP